MTDYNAHINNDRRSLALLLQYGTDVTRQCDRLAGLLRERDEQIVALNDEITFLYQQQSYQPTGDDANGQRY